MREEIKKEIIKIKKDGKFEKIKKKWIGMKYELKEKDYLKEGER